jgi:hypothetical protein
MSVTLLIQMYEHTVEHTFLCIYVLYICAFVFKCIFLFLFIFFLYSFHKLLHLLFLSLSLYTNNYLNTKIQRMYILYECLLQYKPLSIFNRNFFYFDNLLHIYTRTSSCTTIFLNTVPRWNFDFSCVRNLWIHVRVVPFLLVVFFNLNIFLYSVEHFFFYNQMYPALF